ncbi:peptidylprolyl isomerase [Shewanella sp. 1_MG-2023]|uniref:peptidylprolyl isomerase n=1 Tax=unclassified Shewanella TaxID=196818 RepID=UPI000C8636A1|nr:MULTISPECIES: peptidylprolyl isomerase [unclassified Shewanella]MCC4832613.1 peptidylprolyl isomerase [Shewanella sp. 10N.7]MDO6612523.1 peptidylprolyl isomerase [Shewanella sp. 7_MG-2023]MDO6772436.1 peptidylprolyl isomerase [Shewanella sp. 2_MG-2023]MDO6794566.1 peptidylprolyl isomerase [Shewanella sp. 1_MG-2023]PMG75044.1 peptidylprolyl isomerase [Shewanella sp. 10N.286.51.B7]
MKLLYPLAFALTLSACGGSSDSSSPEPVDPVPPVEEAELQADICYLMSTTLGDITLAIDTTNTPITGENFKSYVDEEYYSGTIFHRVIYNFVSQAGGFTSGLVAKPGNDPIELESNTGLTNARGTIAMARTNVANSATSQFYINALDNPQLDYSSSSAPGYAVFGQVVAGMEVVDQINITDTSGNDVPDTEIIINSVTESTCPQV